MDKRRLSDWLGPVSAGTGVKHLADRIEAIERYLGIYPVIIPPDREVPAEGEDKWGETVVQKWEP